MGVLSLSCYTYPDFVTVTNSFGCQNIVFYQDDGGSHFSLTSFNPKTGDIVFYFKIAGTIPGAFSTDFPNAVQVDYTDTSFVSGNFVTTVYADFQSIMSLTNIGGYLYYWTLAEHSPEGVVALSYDLTERISYTNPITPFTLPGSFAADFPNAVLLGSAARL